MTSSGISESPSGSQNMSTEGTAEMPHSEPGASASVPTNSAAQPAPPLNFLRRFFWLDDKIATAKNECLGPSQPGWREFLLAKDTQTAVEELEGSGNSLRSTALLVRVQLLAIVRCLLLRRGQPVSSNDNSFAIVDWEAPRKLPEIDGLFETQSALNIVHLQNMLGENAEAYVLQLELAQVREVLPVLREIATTLMRPLEREAQAVYRLRIARASRLLGAAVVAFVVLALSLGWYADHSGSKNLALGKPVTVSSQYGGVGLDHHLLVDGDHTNLGFHTDNLPNQFVVIDFGKTVKFDKVVVYNRADCCKERAVPLRLEVSDDNVSYKKLAERTEEFDVWTASLLRGSGRYLRLRLLTTNCFHLSEVEVY